MLFKDRGSQNSISVLLSKDWGPGIPESSRLQGGSSEDNGRAIRMRPSPDPRKDKSFVIGAPQLRHPQESSNMVRLSLVVPPGSSANSKAKVMFGISNPLSKSHVPVSLNKLGKAWRVKKHNTSTADLDVLSSQGGSGKQSPSKRPVMKPHCPGKG